MVEDFILLTEGKVKLKVPNPTKYLRNDGVYEPSWAPVFYNPAQKLNRDISVLALSAYSAIKGESLFLLDAFSGTGVRALRFFKEVPRVSLAIANDLSERAYRLIKENISLNNAEDNVLATSVDANALMYLIKSLGKTVHYVDIDPFGSPKPYIDSALWCVRNGGLVGVTATDTAPLSGAKWRAGSRHYDAHLTRFQPPHYLGLRVLLGYVARRAASMDRYVNPLVSFANKHYYRLILMVGRGALRADEMITSKVGYLIHSPTDNQIMIVRELRDLWDLIEGGHNPGKEVIGPLWVGELGDPKFIGSLRRKLDGEYDYLPTYSKAKELLKILENESLYKLTYSLTEIARRIKVNTPRVQAVVECLENEGLKAVRSHLCSTCVSTNATFKIMEYCVKKTGQKTSE